MKKYANPLQIRYWSTTPYRLGTNAVKYSAIPHVHARDEIPANPGDDFLREAMIRQLATGDALFDFTVQLQISAETMPIEDPGKAWDETVSPFQGGNHPYPQAGIRRRQATGIRREPVVFAVAQPAGASPVRRH